MKKQFFYLMFAVALLPLTAFSQTETSLGSETPKWVSDQGYWVVQGNVHSPKSNTVYFYTLDNQLVYKETLEGMKLKLNKKRVLLRLKTVLEQAVTAWHLHQWPDKNNTRLAIALRD